MTGEGSWMRSVCMCDVSECGGEEGRCVHPVHCHHARGIAHSAKRKLDFIGVSIRSHSCSSINDAYSQVNNSDPQNV